MNKYNSIKCLLTTAIIFLAATANFSQKRAAKITAPPKPIIFAVLDDGKTIEPIAQIDSGKLIETANGGSEPKQLTIFVNTFYKPNTKYSLIFGGKFSGTATVKSSDEKSDCGKNLATVVTKSAGVDLNGFVMGLATNARTQPTARGVRRLPTYAERAQAESLVRAEFAKQSVSASAIKDLHYYNLTAIDVDNDGKIELVGTFWVEISPTEKNLLFFIADLGGNRKYDFGYSEYKKVTPKEMMSGDLKDLDNGIGSELLLDALEYTGDKTAEIFTIDKSFEGNHFYAYSRQNGKWTRVFETYNYHCAY